MRVHGHRGARGLAPENTIPGILAAVALGVDAVEVDVGVTADGAVVLHHDLALNPSIARNRDRWIDEAPRLIRSLTLVELGAYDVGRLRPGSDYAARFPDQRARDDTAIPTLEAALRAAPAARFSVELKTDPRRPGATVAPELMAELVLAAAEAAGALARLEVIAFDWRGLRHLQRIAPSIPLGWLTDARTRAAAALWWGEPAPCTDPAEAVARQATERATWGPDHAGLAPDAIAAAHRLGLAVVPWTVNEVAAMRRLAEEGADGVTTDRPDLAAACLNRG